MKKLILTIFVAFIVFNVQSQCPEKALADKYLKMAGKSRDRQVVGSAYQCKKYYNLVCSSKEGSFTVNGKTIKKQQQAAIHLEEDILETIDKYNGNPNKVCGELKPVKAIYTDSIGKKEAPVVGYWINKYFNKYLKTVSYPTFTFFNGGNFKNNSASSFQQRSNWKKIRDNYYEITISYYDTHKKKYDEPIINTFVIDPASNTATYSYTNRGEKLTSKWYYKGKFYNLYKKSEAEILKTKSVNIQ